MAGCNVSRKIYQPSSRSAGVTNSIEELTVNIWTVGGFTMIIHNTNLEIIACPECTVYAIVRRTYSQRFRYFTRRQFALT